MKRKAMVFLAACVALIVLAQTAVAMEVTYSEQYTMVKAAREAILEKYGLTHATLSMFDETIHSTNSDETTFTFTPFPPFLDTKAVGMYQVVVKNMEATAVTWTHDGADPGGLSAGRLDTPAWGQAQLQNALDIYKLLNRASLAKDGRGEFTEADQAALSQLMEVAHYPEASRPENTEPHQKDISEDSAVRLAARAVLAKYGADLQATDDYAFRVFFHREPDAKDGVYTVSWYKGDIFADPIEYQVQIESPSRKITSCFMLDQENMILPEGPLDDYFIAVLEFMQSAKAVLRLSHEERAELWERINRMEHIRSLPVQYVAPGDDSISEEEAVEAAREALRGKYGFMEAFESLFIKTVTFQLLGDAPCWIVAYTPELKTYLFDYKEKMGDYVAVIQGSEPTVLYAYWSNDESYMPVIFTPDGEKVLKFWSGSNYKPSRASENDWAQALYWDAGVLPFVKTLDEKRHVLEQKNGADYTEWSLADKNEYDQPCRDAGFAPDRYPMGLPGPDDIPEDEALSLAKRAFLSEYGLTEEDLAEFFIRMDYLIINPAKPVWAVALNAKDHPVTEDAYYLELDSETGEIVLSWHAAMGHG